MSVPSVLWWLAVCLLAVVGVAAIALFLMLRAPLEPPPQLASIGEGATRIDAEGLPELTRFQARDGTWLAYRLYPANRPGDRIAILAHGSAGSSAQMNGIARALADVGIAAVGVDFRGHGASGTRGDVAYIGQLDDDLADLIGDMRKTRPDARFSFVGHSSGGGFGLSVADGPNGGAFERFVLLAPYLGYRAPTSRPTEGSARWASADTPRIIALEILRGFGVEWAQSLPVLAFATGPDAKKFVTDRYSYRLMRSYAAPDDWKGAFERAKARVSVIAGSDDELMDAPAYERVLAPLGTRVTILPGNSTIWASAGGPMRSRRLSPCLRDDFGLMSRLAVAARFVFGEFGPLIVFWALALTLGVKPAIAGSIVFILADAAWRWRKGLAFTRLYLLVSALTLIFGAIDLASASPFMLKYEAAVTNVATGAAFVVGAMGEKPIIQEVAEQRGESLPATAEIRAFFRLFTLAWAAYFFLKAAFYVWIVWTLPLLQAMALRSLVGSLSLALMIAVSATQGRRLFFLCRRLGLLPRPDATPGK